MHSSEGSSRKAPFKTVSTFNCGSEKRGALAIRYSQQDVGAQQHIIHCTTCLSPGTVAHQARPIAITGRRCNLAHATTFTHGSHSSAIHCPFTTGPASAKQAKDKCRNTQLRGWGVKHQGPVGCNKMPACAGGERGVIFPRIAPREPIVRRCPQAHM